MKYTINTYGWSMEALGKTLTDEEVQMIKTEMQERGYDGLYEIRFEIEEFMDFDMWDGDIFHISKPFDNGTLYFQVLDENGEMVSEFDINDISKPYDDEGDDKYPYEDINAWPNNESTPNIWLTVDENKGGIFSYEIESDDIPKPEDFSFSLGSIGTPDGDWDFISEIYYKDEALEIQDYLDSTGKSSTAEMFTLNDIDN